MKFKFLHRFFGRGDKEKEYEPTFTEELPSIFDSDKAYIVGKEPYYWALAFECPCGCKEIITLNLLDEVDPRWEFSVRRKKITIYPSIRRVVGCRSHFHIIKGRVQWSYFR